MRTEVYFGGATGSPIVAGVKVGVLAKNDWVLLPGGNRATLSSLQIHAAKYKFASLQEINDTLDAITSPFHVDENSNQVGIFIGGTNQHFYGLGNVERMYNLYEGTKFYYGGVNNSVDFGGSVLPFGYSLSGGNVLGWDAILDRAIADIKAVHHSGQKLHIFGWSRGAAMANDLAARLSKFGIRVDFVGMFDPVFSNTLPGQDSSKVDSTWSGWSGNYVTAQISPNVDTAAAIYAINEDRSFFPASRFQVQGNTRLLAMKAPGGHGEVGGHFQSNMPMQQLNFRAMIEFARGSGEANFKFRGIEEDVARIIDSPVTKAIALETVSNKEKFLAELNWDQAARFAHWSPFTAKEFSQQLNAPDGLTWSPGGFGVQQGNIEAATAGTGLLIAHVSVGLWNLSTYLFDPPQPLSAHFRRDLSWIDREIWNFDIKDTDGTKISVSQETIKFIRSLYDRKINASQGGWMGE